MPDAGAQPQIDSHLFTQPALTSALTNIVGERPGDPEIDSRDTIEPALPSAPSNTSPPVPTVRTAPVPLSTPDSASEIQAQVAFLQRMMPHWFMRPFEASAGGAAASGTANELPVIDALPYNLFKFSKKVYKIGRLPEEIISCNTCSSKFVREFGLLARRDLRACCSSPDGVIALMKQSDNDETKYEFLSLAALEMKTRTSSGTATELEEEIQSIGAFKEVNAGTNEFRNAVPDHAYRTQICQHATCLSLDKVLMVFSTPGGAIKRMVVLSINEEQRNTLFQTQKFLVENCMQFSYGTEAPTDFPKIGEDYSPQYGYAREHHSVDFWLRIWHSHWQDVKERGTPPPCRRLVDIMVSFWNKNMGYVDIMRKVIKSCRAKRGPDSGPGSLMWSVLIDFSIYEAMRLYQYTLIGSKVDMFATYYQLNKARQKSITYAAFIHLLSNEDQLYEEAFERIFPGLIKQVAPRGVPTDSDETQTCRNTTVQTSEATVVPSLPESEQRPTYKQANQYLRQGTPFWNTRLYQTEEHLHCKIASGRMRCVLCCEDCKKGKVHTTRFGRQTNKGCSKCLVSLCKNCFKAWHAPNPLTVPGVLVCPHAKFPTMPQVSTGTATRSQARAQQMQNSTSTGDLPLAKRRRLNSPSGPNT